MESWLVSPTINVEENFRGNLKKVALYVCK